MASETGPAEQSRFNETLTSNSEFDFFLPFLLGLNPPNQPQQTQNQETPRESPDLAPDRIILINPLAQGMVVLTRNSNNSSTQSPLSFDSLFDELISSKKGQPPASKASIDALPIVEIAADGDEQCVVCLDEWEGGEEAVEMPCKHRFHGECIGKWLRIHGSCPVCRYEMPVDEADDEKKTRGSGEGDGERRREAWVWLTLGSRRGSSDSSEDSENDSSSSLQDRQS